MSRERIERGDVITMRRQCDGKGEVGKQYLVLTRHSDESIAVLFPDPSSGNGTHGGWHLGSFEDHLSSLGLHVREVSGWNLHNRTYWEYHSTPADTSRWVAEHIKGESMIPTEFATGNWVTHRDLAQPCRLLIQNGDGEQRWMVHVPEGSHVRSSGIGWRLDGPNTTVETRERAREALTSLGIEWSPNTNSDGFWWVSASACTLVAPPTGATGAPAPTVDTTPSKIRVITLHASWDPCTRSHHPEGADGTHVVVGEHDSYVYYMEPYGSTYVNDRVPQEVKDQMAKYGVPPHNVHVHATSRAGIATDRTLTEAEVREIWPRFRGPLYDENHGPYGWGTYTVAVVEGGEVVWRPGTYTASDGVRVIYTETGTDRRRVDTFSTEIDYARRWGFDTSQTIYSRLINGDNVRWFLPYMDLSLANQHLVGGSDATAKAVEALLNLDAREGQFLDVLTRGAKRLGIMDDLPGFLSEVGLDEGEEYVISTPVQVNGTIVVRQTVKAKSQAQAMAQYRRPGAGEFTVNVPRHNTLRQSGIPTITG